MKYLLLIQQGDTPDTPEAWNRVAEDYQAINETPGVTPGTWMEPPGPQRPYASRTARR